MVCKLSWLRSRVCDLKDWSLVQKIIKERSKDEVTSVVVGVNVYVGETQAQFSKALAPVFDLTLKALNSGFL